MTRPRPQPDSVYPNEFTADHINRFLTAVTERTSAGNAHTQYRSLRTFFGWMVDEDEIDVRPMVKAIAPYVPEESVPIVRDDLTVSPLDTRRART